MCPATPNKNQSRGYVIPIGGAEAKHKDPVILERFIELCGGEDARVLVIPTASLLDETGPLYQELFEGLGAKAMCIPIEERDDCYQEETIAALERATGIFITGGNQLRLSTILGGTPVARTIRRLNAEGVHMAGTSAGAAIVSEHMIAGGRGGPSPRESGVVLAPGLGLTNRVIIDQHFNRRGRMEESNALRHVVARAVGHDDIGRLADVEPVEGLAHARLAAAAWRFRLRIQHGRLAHGLGAIRGILDRKRPRA